MKIRKIAGLAIFAALFLGLASLAVVQKGMADHHHGMSDYHHGKKDIVDTAVGAGSFNTLVAALKAADLVETVKGEGPLTVFAPTDEAFDKLPAGTLENLLKPENKSQLKSILTYHVVPGRVLASDVVKLNSAKTANGKSLTVRSEDGAVMVDNAKVVKTDIFASNGVIHVIDSVVLPN
jgi:uncharacterized surface protein with fasciclin (FAS1) repeats